LIKSFDIVAVFGNKVQCCFDKVERCFDIVAGVDGALGSVITVALSYTSALHKKPKTFMKMYRLPNYRAEKIWIVNH